MEEDGENQAENRDTEVVVADLSGNTITANECFSAQFFTRRTDDASFWLEAKEHTDED